MRWPRSQHWMGKACPICQEQLGGLSCGLEMMLPCRHILCKDCSSAWADEGLRGCPQCHQLIVACVALDGAGCYSSEAVVAAAAARQHEQAGGHVGRVWLPYFDDI